MKPLSLSILMLPLANAAMAHTAAVPHAHDATGVMAGVGLIALALVAAVMTRRKATV